MNNTAKSNHTFEDFLEHGGAEMLATKNPWEVVRFKTARGTHVVYKNSKGNHSFSDDHAQTAWNAYCGKKPWMAPEKTKRRSRKYLTDAIMRRDGNCCFFCPEPFTDENPATIEHLLALASGGNNVLANLALAHEECNLRAATMSVTQKVELRDKLKAKESL